MRISLYRETFGLKVHQISGCNIVATGDTLNRKTQMAYIKDTPPGISSLRNGNTDETRFVSIDQKEG